MSGGRIVTVCCAVAIGVIAGGLAAHDRGCPTRSEALFWTGSDWQVLASALARNGGRCIDYYVSVPPPAGDKTRLRPASVYARIRRLAPNVHPLAEVTLAQTGWARWVDAGHGTWYEAGIEFRRRMAGAGLDADRGETWLLNEFDRSTRVDAKRRLPVELMRGLARPYPRAAMSELVRGLYDGAEGMAALPGAVEIGISFSHQNLPDVAAYTREMAAWLLDVPFWTGLQGRVRWLLREAYPDTRLHGVPGSTLHARSAHLAAYQLHTLELAENAPRSADEVKAFFEETFLPLGNAGYVALGGDAFEFVTAHGNTEISPAQMLHFVSEQVYAIRAYAGRNPGGAPARRIGFSWDPINRFDVPPRRFAVESRALARRLAIAIGSAYDPDGGSASDACRSPRGDWWCASKRRGARFTESWSANVSWPAHAP